MKQTYEDFIKSKEKGAINLKFGMDIAFRKKSKKIKSKWRWLLWLPDDIITK